MPGIAGFLLEISLTVGQIFRGCGIRTAYIELNGSV